MNQLPLKEKVASSLSFIIALLIVLTGIYDFLVIELQVRELIMSVGVFFLLLSVALTPKIFFSSLTDIFKGKEVPAIGNPQLAQSFSLLGIFLCAVGLLWRLMF